jgi:hypothetical protein
MPSVESSDQVWKVYGHQWNVEEECRFGEWVEANITEDFFIRYKIPVDCADVPYAVRWIYARIAHLPAAATTKDGKLIGHWSTEWRHLPTDTEWYKDRRFRTALLKMLVDTSTRTLPLDTYPIRIDPESVTAGTAFFVTESHSGIIGHVSLDGSYAHPLQTWEATVPAKIQKISEKSFLSPRPESTIHSGLVKFRWPVIVNGRWQQLPPKQHPFYSEEQYSSTFYDGYADYMEAVAKRIDPTEYDPWEKMLKVLETTAHFVRARIPIVLEGYKRCHKGGCPEGSDLWEDYSTPGRDGFILLLMDHLKELIESNHLDPEAVRREMEAIRLDISKDRSITFDQLYQEYAWLSPRPEDPIEARWGLRKCDMILARVRQARKSIHFIEKTYRKKDPKYADFSTQQQQEIIRRLWVDWDRFKCEDTEVSKTPPRP